MSYSVFSDKNIWSCEIHSGCLFSIPCDCSNCQKYSDYLAVRSQRYSLQNNLHQELQEKTQNVEKELIS